MFGEKDMLKLLLLFPVLMLTSCWVDHRASGEVTTTGEQKVTVEVIVRMDISGCLELPVYDRLACVQAIANSLEEIAGVAEILLCVRDLEEASVSESTDPPESCRRVSAGEGGGTQP